MPPPASPGPQDAHAPASGPSPPGHRLVSRDLGSSLSAAPRGLSPRVPDAVVLSKRAPSAQTVSPACPRSLVLMSGSCFAQESSSVRRRSSRRCCGFLPRRAEGSLLSDKSTWARYPPPQVPRDSGRWSERVQNSQEHVP